MELDWESIVHGEFPAAESGYDPAAVEAHLIAVAEAVRKLATAPQPRGDSFATDVSQQVQAIVSAAEVTAAQIRDQTAARSIEIEREVKEQTAARAAEIEREVRDNITRATKAEVAQARQDAARVSATSMTISGALDTLGVDFAEILRELRERANTIRAAMAQIEDIVSQEFELEPLSKDRPGPAWAPAPAAEPSEVEEIEAEAAVPPPVVHEPVVEEPYVAPPAVHEPVVEEPYVAPPAVHEPVVEEPYVAPPPPQELAFEPAEEEPAPAEFSEPEHLVEDEPVAAPAPAGDVQAEVEDARIIALDMALSGHTREDIGDYVSNNFDIPNPGGLVDEVLASVED